MEFQAKVRRVQNDLKEPKDGSERVITTIVLVPDTIDDDTLAQVFTSQHKGVFVFRASPVQAELPLRHGDADEAAAE